MRIVCVVAELVLHAWPQRSIFGRSKDLVLAPRTMGPKQLRFRLMMGIVGDWGTMANERHHRQGQECSNTVTGLRVGSEPTSDQYQVARSVTMGRLKTDGFAGVGTWGT